jgi:hypothetical protein
MNSKTTLHEAAAKGQVKACEQLLREGALVDELDSFGCTPLASALLTYSLTQLRAVDLSGEGLGRVEDRLAETVRLLLAHGANIELVRQSDHGPLRPEVEAWFHAIEARWRSDSELQALESNTASATGMSRSSRL